MNFVTTQFVLFFLPVVVLCWYTRCGRAAHLMALCICNYYFYAQTGKWGIAVLVAVSTTAYLSGLLLARKKIKKRFPTVFVSVGFCVLLLAIFKYHDFMVDMAKDCGVMLGLSDMIKGLTNSHFVSIAGISFFTFQAISYIADVYKGEKIKKPYSLLEVFAYISFFPTIMSGPIMRASDFVQQVDHPITDSAEIQRGFLLILSGLFKKVVLSSYLSEHIVRQVFAAPESYSSAAIAVGIYGYAIQIFCDFSGYTDLALGVGRLLGYRLPPNFNSPYLATNLKDFWNRWHISLSSWLRDYLYIAALGGNRKGKTRTYVNLLLTMLIGGLWHGGAWTFVIWGGLHGLGLVIYHAFAAYQGKHPSRWLQQAWAKALAWLLTFHFVCLLWVFFRADSVDMALTVLGRLAEGSAEGSGFPLFALAAIGIGICIQQWGKDVMALSVRLQAMLPWQAQGVGVGLAASIIMAMGPEGVLPFIYFRF